jgi:hypothetical protein
MINVVIKPDAIELPVGAVARVPGTWRTIRLDWTQPTGYLVL